MSSCRFAIPLLPPSVNHYVEHKARGVHVKSAAAKAWERDFPLFARDHCCRSESGRFKVTIEYTPGPGQKGDADNYNKLVLDCCAKRGMFQGPKGVLSDAAVKWLLVVIRDEAADRARGPETLVLIEAM